MHGATCREPLAGTNLHGATCRATCAEQLAQTNLHRPVCAEHLAQSNLRRVTCAEQLARTATCAEQLAQSNLRMCRRLVLDLACDVLLSGQPWSSWGLTFLRRFTREGHRQDVKRKNNRKTNMFGSAPKKNDTPIWAFGRSWRLRCVSRGSELRTAEMRLERILHGGRVGKPWIDGMDGRKGFI